MSNYLNFLDENAQFQQFMQSNEQKKEAYKQQKEEGALGLIGTMPVLKEGIKSATEVYGKGKALYEKGQEAVQKFQDLSEKAKVAKSKLMEASDKVQAEYEKRAMQARGFKEDVEKLGSETKTKAEQFGEKTLTKGKQLAASTQSELEQLKGRTQATAEKLASSTKADVEQLGQRTQRSARSLVSRQGEGFERAMSDPLQHIEDLKSRASQLSSEPKRMSFNDLGNELDKIKERASSKMSDYGKSVSKQMRESAFETDPETSILTNTERRAAATDIKSVFRGSYSPKVPEMSEMRLVSPAETTGRIQELAKTTASGLKTDISKGISDMTKTGQGAVTDMTKTGQGAVTDMTKTAQGIQENALKGISATKSDIMSTGQKVGGDVQKGVMETLTEGKTIAEEAASKAANLAKGAATAIGETGEAIGGIVSESLGPIGELAMAGYGIYDLIHSFVDKPHIYSEARAVNTAGL